MPPMGENIGKEQMVFDHVPVARETHTEQERKRSKENKESTAQYWDEAHEQYRPQSDPVIMDLLVSADHVVVISTRLKAKGKGERISNALWDTRIRWAYMNVHDVKTSRKPMLPLDKTQTCEGLQTQKLRATHVMCALRAQIRKHVWLLRVSPVCLR